MSFPVVVFLPWVIDEIGSYFQRNERILNIGAGSCYLERELSSRGFKVTSLDVENKSLVEEIDPTIYDGEKIPFEDKEFDIAFLFYVLHHTEDPEKVLLEAKRVARKILVKEDLYTSAWQKHLVFFIDSVLNFDFSGHPHSNRRDEEWKDTFKKLGLRVVEAREEHYLLFSPTGKYLLDSEG
jgi:SAM-dependent methyltransferase